MTDDWYCTHDGRTLGPFTFRELEAMLPEVPNWRDLRVWRNGFSEWEKAGDLEEFASLAGARPARPTRQRVQRRTATAKTRAQNPPRTWSMTKVLSGVALIVAVVIGGAFGMVISNTAQEPATSTGDGSPQDGTQDKAQDRTQVGTQARIELQGQTKVQDRVEPEERRLQARIAKGLEGLGPTLPKKVDDLTTMIAASNEGTKVVFRYRLAVDGDRLNDNVKAKVRELATKDICAEKQSREVLDLGGSFQLAYADINGKPVTTVEIANGDCP
jgi:hypothetical protein